MSNPITILKPKSWLYRIASLHGVRISRRFADFAQCQEAARLICNMNAGLNRAAVVRVLPSLHAPEIFPAPETKDTSTK